MYSIDNLRFVMDETSIPYEKNETPFAQIEPDNEFEQIIINKYHLITKEMEKNWLTKFLFLLYNLSWTKKVTDVRIVAGVPIQVWFSLTE